jgi:phosphoribosylglycinamide formyltransferase 1
VTSRIAVLASGAGSNLQAILAHLAAVASAAKVALVASDRPTAGALSVGTREGIPVTVVRDPGDAAAVVGVLDEYGIDLVVLAGYLRRIPDRVTRRYRGRMLNVHPALLPAFGGSGMYGHHVHQAVLDAGVRVTGATVHFVDEEFDHGPIIAQWPAPVLPGDTVTTLAARVLSIEHRLYPCAVAAVASGRVTLDDDNRVQGQIGTSPDGPAFTLQAGGGGPPCAP